MAFFSVDGYEFEIHDDRNSNRSEVADKHAHGRGKGLNMAKRSHNFKQIEKAALRMKQKQEQEIIRKQEEKELRREELASKKWKVDDKEQIRKEKRRSDKKKRREERRNEKQVRKCLLEEENREIFKKPNVKRCEDM